MLDTYTMTCDYARCYKDKSRITFIEKYFYTFNAMKGKKLPFTLFPRQKAFLEALAANRNIVAVKPRQCGISTLSSAWIAAECAFASKDTPITVLCIANKLDQAGELIIKIRDFLEMVPRWYWGEEFYSADPKSDKNKEPIFVKNTKTQLDLFNGCRIIARASGPNAARGISAVSVLLMDEAAFIEEGVAAYTTASATMASNPKSKTIMVSTPFGHDELYYNTYMQALSHENNFVAVQFRWYQDPRFNRNLRWYKKNEETNETKWDDDPVIEEDGSIKYDEERWERLVHDGFTPTSPWYEDMCKGFNNDSMKIAQELDVSFLGSADNVVAQKFIDMQEKLNVREPLTEMSDPLVDDTWFWKPPIDGHKYILSCLPEGEHVMTDSGEKNVEDVSMGDKLVTKDGEYTGIKTIFNRNVVDEDVYSLKVSGILDEFRFTHNHPIWASIYSKYTYKGTKFKKDDGKWACRNKKFFWRHEFTFHDASEIKDGSWLQIPNVYTSDEMSVDDMRNSFPELSDTTLFSEDFWWYCGIWIAEGCTRDGKNYIQTTHNINEIEIVSKARKLITETIGCNTSVLERVQCNATDVVFYSETIKNFLVNNFGKFAHGKYISEQIKRLPKKFKLQLIRGYFDGDGGFDEEKWSATTISKKLANDMQDLIFSCGIICRVRVGHKESVTVENGREVHRRTSYVIDLSKCWTKELLGEDYKKPMKFGMYFSDDKKYIYLKVDKVTKSKYTGIVYNFETVSTSHTFSCRGVATHNCDPSRGVSADRTGIVVIDMDGEDEHGEPIVEEVMEYCGKKLGDEIGALCYNYATLYNNAFVVVDCTGGQGDAAILTMLQMGYKNLYYEDMSQKLYTTQNLTRNQDGYTDKLPGFHFQGNRYPVLSNFASMIRFNEIKIRSQRVINELQTWIFDKNGKMIHQNSAHDDLICSFAMALFVMRYTVNRIDKSVSKDKAILAAYMSQRTLDVGKPTYKEGTPISDMTSKYQMPFYKPGDSNGGGRNIYNGINGNYMWLFGGKI